MRRRLIIAVVSSAVAVAGFGLGGSTAYAACASPDVCTGQSTLAATLTGTLGTRSVATVAPITLASILNGTQFRSTWDTTVAEVNRSGTNPWSIQATLQGGSVSDGALPTPHTIPASDFVISGSTASVVGGVGGGGTWAGNTGGPLDGSTGQPLCTNTGQTATSSYTGTYDCTGTITLTPPNNTPNGAYTGTFIVTLVQ